MVETNNSPEMISTAAFLRSNTFPRVLAACLLMAALGTLYTWSVFVSFLEAELAGSRSLVSTIFSVATICFTLGMTFAPSLEKASSVSSRVLLACIVAATGLALAALGGSYELIVLGFGVMFGLANGLGYGLSLHIVQAAPSESRGLLTGVAVASYMAGSVIGSPILEASLRNWGFKATLLLLAAAILAAGLLVIVLLSRLGPEPPFQRSAIGESTGSPSWLEFTLLWSCFFFMSVVGMMIIAHAAPIVASRGGVGGEIVLAATLAAAGNGVGRIAGGWLSDRLPAHAILGGAPALTFLALSAAVLVGGVDGVLTSLFLVGVGYGCIASALPSIVAKNYGVAKLTRLYGKLFTAWGAAGLIGPLAGGLLFDAFGDYGMALIAAAIAALAALLTGWAFRFARR